MTTLQKILQKTKEIKATSEAAAFTKILNDFIEDEKKMLLSASTIGYLTALKETAEIIIKRIEEIKKELEKK